MEVEKKDFFWPSYVDLLTALFAVVLVLFILSYYNFTKVRIKLEDSVEILREDSLLLAKVKKNQELFTSDKEVFLYDSVYKRVQIAFNIKFRRGYQYFKISPRDIESDNYPNTADRLNELGKKLDNIIKEYKHQKMTDSTMKDISYLLVISGSASRIGDDEYQNYLVSYNRALHLYKYWKDSLDIDFDAPQYHDIVELQIAGIGEGGVGRLNFPFNPDNQIEEEKNQRFIIYLTPKL